MRRFSFLNIRRAGAIFSVMLTTGAQAQLSTASTASGRIDGTPVACGSNGFNFVVGVTATCDVSDPASNRVQASARADKGGRLRGLAVATSTGVPNATIATATVAWTERITYRPLTRAVSLRFGFGFSGFESSAGVSTSGGTPAASVLTFIRLGVRREGSFAASAFDELLVRRTYNDYGTSTDRSTEIERTTRGVTGPFSSTPGYGAPPIFLIDLDVGSVLTDFSWSFSLNAFINGGASGTIGGFYFNTATINDLALVDENGTDVSNEFDLRFESGAQYAVVPEPLSIVLLAIGLMAIAIMRRRNRVAP